MKSAIAFAAIALIVVIMLAPPTKACTFECEPYEKDIDICGRNDGTSNCRHFPDACRLRLFNCMNNKSYYEVALSKCKKIPIGTTDVCGPA